MRWGIKFSVPSIHRPHLWTLPPPSTTWMLHNERLYAAYYFEYAPQSKKEWQRVAGIKVQISRRFKDTCFYKYESFECDGQVYKVSELGKHFTESVRFPAPFFDGTPLAILTRHAKRLHYEDMLHIEQLIFVSMWIKEIAPKNETGRRKKDEGIRQVMRRATSAYLFALEHIEEWPVKLSAEERHKKLSVSAMKSAQVKRDNTKDKRIRAKALREDGETLSDISSLLGVSLSTIQRWLKQ